PPPQPRWMDGWDKSRGGGTFAQQGHPARELAQPDFVAAAEFFGAPAGIADLFQGLAHFRPVHVAFIGEFAPLVAVPLEVFPLNLVNALAEGANPVFWISENDHVAHVKVGL